MKDGWYWLNDIACYGWEIVRVENGVVSFNGDSYDEPVSSPRLKGLKWHKIEEPTPRADVTLRYNTGDTK